MATCKDCGVHLTAENTYGGKATWKCKPCHSQHIVRNARARKAAEKPRSGASLRLRKLTRDALSERASANGMTQDQMVQHLLAVTAKPRGLFAALFGR